MKYLENGAIVHLQQKLENGKFLVYPCYEYSYDNDDNSPELIEDANFPMIVDHIFDEPPKEKMMSGIQHLVDKTVSIRSEIDHMNDEIKELRNTKFRLNKEVAQMTEQHELKIDELQKYEGLNHLRNFLDKKITHFVVEIYKKASVYEFKDFLTLDDEDDYTKREGGLKLITLYGDSEGVLSWNIGRYSSYHHNEKIVHACLSLEEAEKVALDINTKEINSEGHTPSKYELKEFKKNNCPIPEGYEEEVRKLEKEANNKKIKELQEEIKKLR